LTDASDWSAGGFGLYLHWPFCAAKCPYCDFNSHVADSIDDDAWAEAYLSELRRVAELTRGRHLDSVFFGGGTPSLMAPETVNKILSQVRALWPAAASLEVTVETGRFRAFRDAGVNRISMGIQALDDEDLRRLGRLHTAAEARAAFDVARETFPRVSFDLIYARQGQSAAAWRAELTEALSMAVDHVSLYQLTIEPGTAFGARHAAGRLRDLPDDDTAADLYEITQDICEAHGRPGYEISNHAAPGAESRHNLIYWRGGDYLGLGPGAHGRLSLRDGRFATETPLEPAAWLERVRHTGSGECSVTPLPLEDQAAEYLMMSLRLAEGSDLDRLARLGYEPNPDTLADLEDLRLVARHGARLRATRQGRPVLNAVLRALLTG
jgi:oxygen-independent coproporphyrinogen-3 oxidase